MASKRSSKAKKQLQSKPLIPKWKLGIGIGAAILLIVVVLFSKQIGQLLDMIGIDAFEIDPTLTIELDPQTQETKNYMPEEIVYDLIITEDYGIDLGYIIPFTGQVILNIDDLIGAYPNLIEDVYFTNTLTGTQVTEITIGMPAIDSYPVPLDGESLQPPPTLTIVTKKNEFNNELIDFQVSLDLLWKDPNGIMDDVSIIPPPEPADGQLKIWGKLDYFPNFTITVTPLSQEVDSGDITIYDIEITTTLGFNGDITLNSAILESHIDAHLIYAIFDENPLSMIGGETKNINLTIATQPGLTSQEIIDFTVFGRSDMSYMPPDGNMVIMIIVNATSNLATLIINPLVSEDFSIILGDIVASSTAYRDELSRDVVIPGSSISYNVILNRFDGFAGNVNVDSASLDSQPIEIDYYEFANGGLFTDDGNNTQQTVLTIYITDTDDTQIIDIDFNIDGHGDIDGDGTPEHRPSNFKTFSIVDYTITIQNTPQTVGAGSDATYIIVITSENQFNDSISLTIIEDLIGDYPEHIIGVYLDPLPINIDAEDVATNRDLIIHTNPRSPGTDLGGIPFHVQGDSIGLFRHVESNEGVLNITSDQDFVIQVVPQKNRVIPGGEATYTVTATGLLGFSQLIDLSTSWDIPNMPSYITSVSFDETTIVPGDNVPGVPTILHITTNPNAPPISSGDPEGQFRVMGTSGTDVRFADADLDIVDFTIEITDPAPDLNGDSIRTISSGGETTYIATVTRLNNLTEDIILTTDLVSVNGSISSLIFGGPQVTVVDGEYILKHIDSLIQTITLRVTTFNPIPSETINFYIYGDTTTAEDDDLTRQSNRGVLNITNDYDFNLLINPASKTVAPTGTAEYTIEVVRLNGFTGDITLISSITELNGEQVSYVFDTITLTLNPVFPFLPDTATLTVTADADALSKQISFTVNGHADLFGVGDITYGNVSAEIIIIDFDIQIDSPKNQTITDIEPNNMAEYGITLIRHGGYDRAVTITTDLTSINYPGIISSSVFENGGIFGVSDTTTKLIVYAENSAPIINFDVTGTDAPTGLSRLDSGSLTINDGVTPDFLVNIDPGSRTIEPGGATTYTVDITRINGWSDTIILTTNLLTLDNRVESAEFDITELLDGVNQATLSVISKLDAISSTIPTTFTVFGDSNGAQRSADADLVIYKEVIVIVPPSSGGGTTRDFSITIDPSERTVLAGDTATYIVIINRTNFTGDILLSNIIANNPNIKSATLDQTIIDNETRETILTVITESGAEVSTIPIIINGTAIIYSRETERNGEAVLYIHREGEAIEEIIIPEEELPSTGPELIWLLLGLAALLITTILYKKPKPKKTK